MGAYTPPWSDSEMIDLARRQIDYAGADPSTYPTGGELIVVKLTKDRMTIEKVADLS